MQKIVWFCIGIVAGRWGIPIFWHLLYWILIIAAIIAGRYSI